MKTFAAFSFGLIIGLSTTFFVEFSMMLEDQYMKGWCSEVMKIKEPKRSYDRTRCYQKFPNLPTK